MPGVGCEPTLPCGKGGYDFAPASDWSGRVRLTCSHPPSLSASSGLVRPCPFPGGQVLCRNSAGRDHSGEVAHRTLQVPDSEHDPGKQLVTSTRQVATPISVKVATSTRIEVGFRDLKNNLSRHLGQVEAGVEVVVTDRGRPIARLHRIADGPMGRRTDGRTHGVDRGRPGSTATSKVRPRPVPLHSSGSVSELVAEQRE